MAKELISYQDFRKLLAGTDCDVSSEWKDCKSKRGGNKKKCSDYAKKNCSPKGKKAKKAPKKVSPKKKKSPRKSSSPKRKSVSLQVSPGVIKSEKEFKELVKDMGYFVNSVKYSKCKGKKKSQCRKYIESSGKQKSKVAKKAKRVSRKSSAPRKVELEFEEKGSEPIEVAVEMCKKKECKKKGEVCNTLTGRCLTVNKNGKPKREVALKKELKSEYEFDEDLGVVGSKKSNNQLRRLLGKSPRKSKSPKRKSKSPKKKSVSPKKKSASPRARRESSLMREMGAVYAPPRARRESSLMREMGAVYAKSPRKARRESSLMREMGAVYGPARTGKKCYDKDNYLECSSDQLCSSKSGKCLSRSKGLKKGAYVLELPDRPSIVGSKDSLESIRKNLGKGKIVSISEMETARKEAEEGEAFEGMEELAAEIEKELAPKRKSKSPRKPSPVKVGKLISLTPPKRVSPPKKKKSLSPAKKASLKASPRRASEKVEKQREEIKRAFETCLATI